MCLGTSQAYMMYKMTDSLFSGEERRKYCSCDFLFVPFRSLLHKGKHNIPNNACLTEKTDCNGSVYQCPVVEYR